MVGNVGREMTSPPLDNTHGWKHRAWHAILALRRQTWSNDVGRGMPSSPFGSTDNRTASGVACDHRLWPSHTVERRLVSHAILAFGQHIRSNDVGRGMPSSPLGSTHSRTTSGVACIIAFGQHTLSKAVGRGIPSWPLDSTHGRTTLGVACPHSP